ncbi:serine/threonine protein kinase [Metarhizium album ARSEF 1941]|uniref:non-specific serine/threonine protein kinase n=1 Tax=Metarhizium album (strain ARSEF 1941) TaxID=1081103 RepID=A0A0B2WRR3_METAS|nr:serine/threonine protein kinase [Metarhizium album ARSEF 1941]KHN95675.1 serine/threonine protein kinase [Metarhizium album ARSEF 1941]
MAAPTAQLGVADATRNNRGAVEDARKTQSFIVAECASAGTEPPPYELMALIGKGSFGRVYKARGLKSRQLVAVKIISIEEGDSIRPGGTDTFGDILKEVNTLKLLNDGGAKNVNRVLDTHLVGQSVWVITEYCAGGSVATLMRPTRGLAEKWIVPVLREVAEAVHWVHSHGVIHRDIKCANVLITDAGGVQLCDFGVAGIIETKFDKRSTVTGTLQWMAPELFDSSISYGIEVDIWAFGSMAYEAATGLPPNATGLVDRVNFGSYLKDNCPRLQGDQYSSNLRDIIAFCMVQDPAQRPSIEQVQAHPYISNTASRYPTASLSQLVKAYRLWETQGGIRQSLFSAGGAQGPASMSSPPPLNDGWNFETLNEASPESNNSGAQTILDVYGPAVDLPWKPPKQPGRRRQPNVKPLVVPLEQVFDPTVDTNYNDNARVFYGYHTKPPTNDLPLRDDLDGSNVRESLIDLDVSLDGNHLSQFVDIGTIRAGPRPVPDELYHPTRPLTQDWKFPLMAAVPGISDDNEDSQDDVVYDFDANDVFVSQSISDARPNRVSAISLIDLDASIPDEAGMLARPSTASSDNISIGSDAGKTPFELEYHVTEASWSSSSVEKPSIYVSDDGRFGEPHVSDDGDLEDQTARLLDDISVVQTQPSLDERLHSLQYLSPAIPAPPSTSAMLGTSSHEELKGELQRLIRSLGEHLRFTSDTLTHLPAQRGVRAVPESMK